MFVEGTDFRSITGEADATPFIIGSILYLKAVSGLSILEFIILIGEFIFELLKLL